MVLILSLAACEHASTATSTSTLPEETASAEVEPAPAPAAKLVTPEPAPEAKTVAPDCSEPVRQTRAAVKWKEGCEPARVTKKQPTDPNTGTPAPAEPTP